jgi:hypothetical protein
MEHHAAISLTITFSRLSQLEKAEFPMLVTEWGIAIEDKLLQSTNAYSSIIVILLGIIIEIKLPIL